MIYAVMPLDGAAAASSQGLADWPNEGHNHKLRGLI